MSKKRELVRDWGNVYKKEIGEGRKSHSGMSKRES